MIDCLRFVRQLNTESENRAQITMNFTKWRSLGWHSYKIDFCAFHIFSKRDFHSKMIFKNNTHVRYKTKTIKFSCKYHISTFNFCYKIAFNVCVFNKSSSSFECKKIKIHTHTQRAKEKRSEGEAKWMNEWTNEENTFEVKREKQTRK